MLKSYITIAIRMLMRRRIFSFLNILGLAVGMTACLLIFLYVKMETSYDAFHSKADRIYRVVTDVKTESETLREGATTAPIAINTKREFPEVEDAVRFSQDAILVRKGAVKFQEQNTLFADSTLFNVFDFPLLEGNKNTALREPMSVVMSKTAARKYFGDADPMGQQLLLTGAAIPAKITGIMKDIPENSQIRADMFLSMSSTQPVYGQPTSDSEWTNHNYYTYLLLKPNTDYKAFEKKLPAFMEKHHGAQSRELQMFETLTLEPLRDVYLRSKRDGYVTGNIGNVYIFSAVGVFILLIACINYINLSTARSVERAREVGVRKVIGAERYQLTWQFIGESVIICLLSFVLSLLLATLLLPLFNQLAGKEISSGLSENPVQVLWLFGLSLFIGVAAGLYPSLVLSAFRPGAVLKGSYSAGTKGLFLRKSLVVFQFAVAIALIASTLIVFNQLNFMRNQDLGFSKDQTLIIQTNYDKNKDAFKASLAEIPGVLATAASSSIQGGNNSSAYSRVQNKTGEMQKTNLDLYFVDFDYVSLYKLKILAGRGFSRAYGTDSSKAMMINETAARLLGYRDPSEAIGRDYSQWGSEGKIIGVFKDFHFQSLQKEIKPLTMRFDQGSLGVISVRISAGNAQEAIDAIRKNWNRIIPNRPFEYYFLDNFFNRQYKNEENFGRLFLNFAVLAIFISCLGLLALSAYSTLQRTREIAVRKVLGASVSGLVRLLSVQFMKLVGVAFLLAVPVSWLVMHRWLQDFAYRTGISAWIFVLAGGASLLIAFATISFQSIRAALSNPVNHLRSE